MTHRRSILAAAAAVAAMSVSAQAGVVKLSTGRWPGGAVAFQLDRSLTVRDRTMIAAAVGKWNAALARGGAGARFIPRTRNDQSELLIVRIAPARVNRCRASLGYLGQAPVGQTYTGEASPVLGPRVNGFVLLSGTCTPRSVVHELGHVLGLAHEQNRNDRDAWIAIAPIAPYREPNCAVRAAGEWPDFWCGGYARSLDVRRPARALAGNPELLRTDALLFTRQYDVCSVMQYVEDKTHAHRHVSLKFTATSHAFERGHRCRAGGAGGGVISSLDVATVRAFYGRGAE